MESPENNICPTGIITFTSDFGQKDAYVGQVKGVIYSRFPGAKIVDLTHHIRPQDVKQAAWTIKDSAKYFPSGTVHLLVVDPGVGSSRRPLAIQNKGHFFVGPDNGVFSAFFPPDKMVILDKPDLHLKEVSSTFHGRDIFAPCAALLAKGTPISNIGSPAADPVKINMPSPQINNRKITGEIIQADHFGNLISNIHISMLEGKNDFSIMIKNKKINNISSCYSSSSKNDLIALVGSLGRIEIAVVNGSAQKILDADVQDIVEVIL